MTNRELIEYIEYKLRCLRCDRRQDDRIYNAHLNGEESAYEDILQKLKEPVYNYCDESNPLLDILQIEVSSDLEAKLPNNSGYVEMTFTPAGTVVFTPTNDPKKEETKEDLKKVF